MIIWDGTCILDNRVNLSIHLHKMYHSAIINKLVVGPILQV